MTALSTAVLAALAPPVALDDGLPWWGLWAAGLVTFAFVLVHTSLTFAVGAATGAKGPAMAAGAGVAVTGFMVQALASVAEPIEQVRAASPWYWLLRDNPVATGPDWLSFGLPLALSAAFVAVGVLAFARRDRG